MAWSAKARAASHSPQAEAKRRATRKRKAALRAAARKASHRLGPSGVGKAAWSGNRKTVKKARKLWRSKKRPSKFKGRQNREFAKAMRGVARKRKRKS